MSAGPVTSAGQDRPERDNYLLPLRMAECSAKTLTAQNPSHQSATNLRIDGAEPVYFSRS